MLEGWWTRGRIDRAAAKVARLADDGELEAAAVAAEPLRRVARRNRDAAAALVALIDDGHLRRQHALPVAEELAAAYPADLPLLVALADASDMVRDIDDLNAAALETPLFAQLVQRLRRALPSVTDRRQRVACLRGLASAARALGPAGDDEAEGALLELVALDPDDGNAHYRLGLYYKTRGRFADGVAANLRALAAGSTGEATQWNLGICATGAGDGARALAVWQGLTMKVALAGNGRAEGGFPMAKVRVAQHPLALRRAGGPDGPGAQENIWIERVGPCHGIIRSAVYADELGVDYGDVVLFDGAPITHHVVDGREVAVFPHLVTLEHAGYQIYPLAGTQPAPRLIAGLSAALPDDSVAYVHTEQVVLLCQECSLRHGAGHPHQTREHRVVRGKLCAPPGLAPAALLAALDAAVAAAGQDGLRVLVPALADAAGDPARAEVERRRWAMLDG
ncbi:MAG: hypothetical protein KA297_31100 [Kofleriaceae bacterium]|nr:hypothetical protein [Kofleriaceae bacterium]